ncbi:DUF3307 domain-containing protein [Xanthomarina sp. F2636L]|uniref:DUF3307 domain-containing protein n=1 Tax=Xanthomarina sp. F2636L TaxID=2996018 RepID=UPI00225DF0E4|nr:DUF3307 domain-containing protein [Xanthomarina sp. F2636L]MCX7550187.1 DUF3307 domain-containing protein [Xanthomarina sp. F2636L]
MMLLIKLFLAHLIGDFVFQTKKSIKQKERLKLKSPALYIHIAIHFVLLILLLWDITLWPIILTITISHFIIDVLKLKFQKKKTKRLWFFLDQLLHIIMIFVAYFLFTDNSLEVSTIFTETNVLLLTCVLFLTQPVSIIMMTIFSKWNIDKLTTGNESLKDAGRYIGMLERLLVFIFIISDHWEAVGFLITAKSVFRFGDLKESKHRKLTEYILIGTLISFGIAILTGILFLKLI